MDRAGNRVDVASLIGGETRGDQRSRRKRRFDDQAAAREAADQAIAAWKIVGNRRRAQREFRYERALLGDLRGEFRVAPSG